MNLWYLISSRKSFSACQSRRAVPFTFTGYFEIEKFYPTAYKVVVDYRNWLVTQIHQLLLTIKATATLEDAYMFLFVIDGTMVQLLSKDRIDERDKLLDYF